MNVVRYARSVDEDASVGSEDESLAQSLTLLVARYKFVAQFFKNDHILVNYWQNKSKVNDRAIPLSSLVLCQDSFDKVI